MSKRPTITDEEALRPRHLVEMREAPVHLEAPFGELLGDDLRRPHLLEGKLRMLVQVVPDGDEIAFVGLDAVFDHGSPEFLSLAEA